MKTLNILFLSLLFCMSASAANDWDVSYQSKGNASHELTFDINSYDLVEKSIDGQYFSTILLDNSVNLHKKGYAELPFINAAVNIMDYESHSITITASEYTDIELRHPLLPSRGIIYRDQDPSTIPYKIDPNSIQNKWYPDLMEHSDDFFIREDKGISVYIRPFQYNAVTQKLRVYSKVKVRIEPRGKLLNQKIKNDKVILEAQGILNSVFINRIDPPTREELSIGEHGDLLVITVEAYEEAMAPYIDWKKKKGYDVSMLTVDQGTNVAPIIQQAYDDNPDLLYVQLAGDWPDIQTDLSSVNSPMDPALGLVSGDDNYIDICVGRFPGNTPEQITTMVNKSISYETTPEGDYYAKLLSVASNDNNTGDDNELDWQHTNVIYDNKFQPFTFDHHFTEYEPTGTTSGIAAAVNEGVSWINYTGHGSPTSWSSVNFSNSDIDALTNENRMPIIISVACNNGDFHNAEDCFGERWVKKENGGAVVTLAASISQPWQPPMRGQDYICDILTGGYDYEANGQSGISTAEQRTTIGAAVANSLVLMLKESSQSDDIRTVKTWNLFGDVCLQVRTKESVELTLSNPNILQGTPYSTVVTMDGQAAAGAMLCVTQGDVVYKAFANENGEINMTHNLLPGEAEMVLTCMNATPKINTISVVPLDGPYITYNFCEVNDADGDDDQTLDYAETAYFNIELKNMGTEAASAITATISTESEYVEILENQATYGDFDVDETIMKENAFKVKVKKDVPENYSALFKIMSSEGNKEVFESNFSLPIQVPVLENFECELLGTEYNNLIKPGESGTLKIKLTNTGEAQVYNAVATLVSTNPDVSLSNSELAIGTMNAEEIIVHEIQVSVSADAVSGTSALFNWNLVADHDIAFEKNVVLPVGKIPALIVNTSTYTGSVDKLTAAFDELNIGYEIITEIDDNTELVKYSSTWWLLGAYPKNGAYTDDYDEKLLEYLNNGGNAYMESGDRWAFYEQKPAQLLFNINGLADGDDEVNHIEGMPGCPVEGMEYDIALDGKSYIDQIAAKEGAIEWMQHSNPTWCSTVVNEGTNCKTIGSSIELGTYNELEEDGFKNMIKSYLEYFSIEMVNVEETNTLNNSITLYPNPSSSESVIKLELSSQENVNISLYDLQGRMIKVLCDQELSNGIHHIKLHPNHMKLNDGVFLVNMVIGDQHISKKWVLMK